MPNIPKSSFTESFVVLNQPNHSAFARWVFRPGMEFQSLNKWWDGTGFRPAPHEGLDFCCFEDKNFKLVHLGEKSLVPVMYAGTVVKIFNDFLGSSILVAHDFQNKGKTLYSLYAHSVPIDTLQSGRRVKAGKAIAMICSTGNKSIPPHLHLSVIWAGDSVIADLDWQTIHQVNGLFLCNPLDFLQEGLTIKKMH